MIERPDPTAYASHTAYSDPGRYRGLLAALPTEPAALSAVARNVIVHYRASACELPESSRDDIDGRWLEVMLATDQGRHPIPLTEPRPEPERVQGCCRDHTLFCVGALRTQRVPARSRVGFAGYFVDGWHHDHVIVEAWLDGRWRRFDSEIEHGSPALPEPMDLAFDSATGPGFVTAAEAWRAHRRGEIDADRFGVDPDLPFLAGPRFLFDEVIYEVAHRYGDELLLWDGWGRIGGPENPLADEDADWLDPVADALLLADAGDEVAERELFERYRADDGLRPGATVIKGSPYGLPPVEVSLVRA
ncbi:MAG: transglutaminase domain-containing protein [Actinomycetota bacterium]